MTDDRPPDWAVLAAFNEASDDTHVSEIRRRAEQIGRGTERAYRLRKERVAEWTDPRHPGCCWLCGWSVSSHGISSYGLDCPGGRSPSPAAAAGHLPKREVRDGRWVMIEEST